VIRANFSPRRLRTKVQTKVRTMVRTRRPRASSPAALRKRKDQTRAMISLRATNKNRDCMHGPTIKSGNHPFRSAARVVQCQLREYMGNRPRRGFAHVGVELGVPAESAGHRCPNASVADPRFQRNRGGFFGLNIKCDWDGNPCRRAGVNSAINKDCTRQHSPRLIVLQAVQ
jgi:hypothetical protein